MRSVARGALLALLLATSAGAADPPAIVEVPRPAPAKWTEVKTDVGRLTRLTAGQKPATWVLAEEGVTAADLDAPAGAAVVTFAATKAGRYKLVAFVEGQEVARVVVVVGDAPPDPQPNPSPGPDPPPVPPAPKADHVWVVVVEETADRTPAVARVLNDAAYWTALRGKGHKTRFYDKDDADAKARGYVGLAQAPTDGRPPVGLPALIVFDQATGKVLAVVKLPADTAGVDAVLKGVTK